MVIDVHKIFSGNRIASFSGIVIVMQAVRCMQVHAAMGYLWCELLPIHGGACQCILLWLQTVHRPALLNAGSVSGAASP